ncbi:putative disease resistance protein RGA4 [Chenopodium quinoa]|uniref:putative disease resistance protein RGA4 n=1 Tax=Chenopodium quinoa TaxID=63459 RepID=UPI000B78D750|nr:putative disease resistance protein RGA4 [Chenopodium quinoa]
MDVGTVMSAAQSLFTALQCSELKMICSIFGYKSQLDDLQRTVFKIKAVLRDTEAKQELSDQDQLYIEDLKDAVYEADDLIDEFVTLAEVKKLTEGEKKASLLPDFRWLEVAYKVSRGVKKFRKRLDDIASYNRKKRKNWELAPGLVLDDVWTENRGQWRTLAGFLMGGRKGSWVVVTTRSQETAREIGDGQKYELQGLSERNSQCLLERMASGSNHSNLPQDLVEIGREIVKGCASVPLAIRVAGSLLYGQDKSRWLSFLKTGQSNIRESQNDIMPILKLSYHHLESSLKSCFSYCALFPKNFVIEKQMLTSLWMAQGYIDVVQDKYGNIISCKIHDLMHDIAQKVAEKEMCVMNTVYGKVDTKARHLSTREFARYSFTKARIRSYLHVGSGIIAKADKFSVDSLLTKSTRLRALDLKCSGIKSLPSTTSELLHLRYLDLSENGDMEVLPKSITRLHNLETLKLSGCYRLKRLPKHTNKLIKLRALDIEGCYLLSCMPPGMGKLTCLHTLPEYVLSTETCSSLKHWVDQLQDLKVLNKLKDNLTMRIQFPKHAVYNCIEDGIAGGA